MRKDTAKRRWAGLYAGLLGRVKQKMAERGADYAPAKGSSGQKAAAN